MGIMRRTVWTAWTGLALALLSGCATSPLIDSSQPLPPGAIVETEGNPVFIAQGPMSYRNIYEHARNILTDFGFSILEESGYEGRIETVPRIEPGLLLFMKPGSPDAYDRLLATFQTYRHRAIVIIEPAQTGFFIHVTVYKELEDLPRPVRATAGAAIFRTDNNVERQFTVIDPTIFEASWIPKGRDPQVEQLLLQKLKCGF